MELSKKQIDKDFKMHILPIIKQKHEKDNLKDKPARCEAYNNYIDSLYKDGLISCKKVDRYSIPKMFL